ncbi:MAG: hypothetical protein OJF52_002523 [Nitrospira sp.]|nr:MAG: hypothetical protein OJF52_002523 [Nitrospira sp.]
MRRIQIRISSPDNHTSLQTIVAVTTGFEAFLKTTRLTPCLPK